MTNNHYKLKNVIAFNFSGFACVSIIVFLSLTQPYFLKQVIGVHANKIGSTIGNLGFFDEIVAIIICPILGVLCDELNKRNSRISGHKLIQSSSFIILFISFLGFSRSSVVSEVFLFRGIFAIGVSACMSMIPVMLSELTNSDIFRNNSGRRRNGLFSALIGISTGIGAIFAVSCLLPLPVNISSKFDISMKASLKVSYLIVSGYALLAGLILAIFLYNRSQQLNHIRENSGFSAYFATLFNGFKLAKSNKRIQLAFVGSFVARSTTVTTSVFIPLLAYNYYSKMGRCTDEDCHDAYVFSAILTGVAQTIALVSSPLWGLLIDSRVGKTTTILISSILGIGGNLGLCLAAYYKEVYDPRNALCFIIVGFIGLSQIGVIITSMSLVSEAGDTKEVEEPSELTGPILDISEEEPIQELEPITAAVGPTIGSVSGLYSLSGGVGILLITKVGGSLSDHYITAPFFILGLFNLVLLGFSLREGGVRIA